MLYVLVFEIPFDEKILMQKIHVFEASEIAH